MLELPEAARVPMPRHETKEARQKARNAARATNGSGQAPARSERRSSHRAKSGAMAAFHKSRAEALQ